LSLITDSEREADHRTSTSRRRSDLLKKIDQTGFSRSIFSIKYFGIHAISKIILY
jgi:hypothetical protein